MEKKGKQWDLKIGKERETVGRGRRERKVNSGMRKEGKKGKQWEGEGGKEGKQWEEEGGKER